MRQRISHAFAMLAAGIVLNAGSGCGGSHQSDSASEYTEVPVSAPTSTRSRSGPNAANEYRRIHERIGKEFMDPLSNMGADTPPNASEAKFLADNQDVVREIIEATKIGPCDFGIEYDKDMDVLFEHLPIIRRFARLLQFDAHRFIRSANGEARAGERLCAILRLSRHVGQEPVIISKLVAWAVAQLAAESVKKWRSHLNSPDVKRQLYEELTLVRGSTMFDTRTAVQMEFHSAKVAIERSSGTVSIEGVEIPIAESEKAGLIAELDRIHRAIDEVWDASDAETRIKQITESARITKARAFTGGFQLVPRLSRRALGTVDAALSAVRE